MVDEVHLLDGSVPKEVFDLVGKPVGYLIVGWAFAGQFLESWATLVWQLPEAKAIRPMKPQKVDEQIACLKKAFRKIAALAPFQAQAIKCLQTMKRLTYIRDTIAHSTFKHYKGKPRPRLFLNHLDNRVDPPEVSQRAFALAEITNAANEIQTLADEMGQIALALADHLYPGARRKAE